LSAAIPGLTPVERIEVARVELGPSQPATFVACYLLPPGEERLIEML
jgi:hypothetical protein